MGHKSLLRSPASFAVGEGTSAENCSRREARCTLAGDGETLEISAAGALGGRAFYDPGEAYTFLGATDEPAGEVLLIPARSSAPLTLSLRLGAVGDPLAALQNGASREEP